MNSEALVGITIACAVFALLCVVTAVAVAIRLRRTRRGLVIPLLLVVVAVLTLAASPLVRIWMGIAVDIHEVAALKREHMGKPAILLLNHLGEPDYRLPPAPGPNQRWIYMNTSPKWSTIGMNTVVGVASNKVSSIRKTWDCG